MSPAPLSPAFSRLARANLAAQSAEQISLAAVPIVAVLALGAGPGEIGALATAQTLPFLLLSIPAGLLADRWSRRRLMVLAEGVRAVALIALLLATASGQLSFALLAALGFIGATGTVGFSVAAPALVPALVAADALAAANGRLELARSAAYAAGPALAGALVAWTGAASAFVLAAVLSGSALALLLRLPEPPVGAPRQRKVWDELRHGAGLVWTHELLRPILFTAIAWNIAWFVLQAAYVPYAMRSLGLDAGGVGFTLACYGAGMVVGALGAARIMRALSFGSAILLGPFVSVLASLVMVASIRWPTGALAALSFFLFGVGPIIWTISSTTLRQTVTPMAVLGQVSAIFLTVNMGARPLGAALGGLIGAAWGEQACLVVAAIGFVVQAVIITCSRVRTLRQLPAAVG